LSWKENEVLIDTHTHAALNWTEESVRETFRRTGADKIILSATPIDHWPVAMNEGCARIRDLFPDRVFGLIGIHPPDTDESLRQIEAYHRRGFLGIKLMPTACYYPDDERFRRIWDEVSARKMICLTHCGWCSRGHKPKDLPQSTLYSHPYRFEPLIRVYPDIDFIFAHGGGRTMFQAAFELVAYHENAWVDTCPGQGTWVFQHAGIWLDVVNWDRVLFGTDMVYGMVEAADGCVSVERFIRVTLRLAGKQDKADAVMSGNALRLLRKHGAAV
jgi:predicted TIM-barrel fold metal-dependent hydrolase